MIAVGRYRATRLRGSRLGLASWRFRQAWGAAGPSNGGDEIPCRLDMALGSSICRQFSFYFVASFSSSPSPVRPSAFPGRSRNLFFLIFKVISVFAPHHLYVIYCNKKTKHSRPNCFLQSRDGRRSSLRSRSSSSSHSTWRSPVMVVMTGLYVALRRARVQRAGCARRRLANSSATA